MIDVMVILPLACLSVVFANPATASTEKQEVTADLNRHLKKASPLKCKNSDSKLQLELRTISGDIIPFFCSWAKKGYSYSCSETGVLASHCPKTCSTCSKYRCADSEGTFIWKEEKKLVNGLLQKILPI